MSVEELNEVIRMYSDATAKGKLSYASRRKFISKFSLLSKSFGEAHLYLYYLGDPNIIHILWCFELTKIKGNVLRSMIDYISKNVFISLTPLLHSRDEYVTIDNNNRVNRKKHISKMLSNDDVEKLLSVHNVNENKIQKIRNYSSDIRVYAYLFYTSIFCVDAYYSANKDENKGIIVHAFRLCMYAEIDKEFFYNRGIIYFDMMCRDSEILYEACDLQSYIDVCRLVGQQQKGIDAFNKYKDNYPSTRLQYLASLLQEDNDNFNDTLYYSFENFEGELNFPYDIYRIYILVRFFNSNIRSSFYKSKIEELVSPEKYRKLCNVVNTEEVDIGPIICIRAYLGCYSWNVDDRVDFYDIVRSFDKIVQIDIRSNEKNCYDTDIPCLTLRSIYLSYTFEAGKVYYRQHMYEDACNIWSAPNGYASSYKYIDFYIGNALYNQQSFLLALQSYEKDIRRNGDHYKTLFNISICYIRIKDYVNALLYNNLSISLHKTLPGCISRIFLLKRLNMYTEEQHKESLCDILEFDPFYKESESNIEEVTDNDNNLTIQTVDYYSINEEIDQPCSTLSWRNNTYNSEQQGIYRIIIDNNVVYYYIFSGKMLYKMSKKKPLLYNKLLDIIEAGILPVRSKKNSTGIVRIDKDSFKIKFLGKFGDCRIFSSTVLQCDKPGNPSLIIFNSYTVSSH